MCISLRRITSIVQNSVTTVTGTFVILKFTGVTLCSSNDDRCRERGRALQETTMYKFLLRTAFAARNPSVCVNESCVLLAICDKAPASVFR